MNTYVLMGGKDASLSHDFSFEQRILRKLKVEHPNILYVQLAQTKNRIEKLTQFKEIKNGYPCEIQTLESIQDAKLKEKLDWANVVYVAGGRASKLIHEVRGSLMERVLKNSSKIWMGISAGAMLFCRAGMGDEFVYSDKGHLYHYQMVSGLNCLDITICPHYNHDGLWCYNDVVSTFSCDGYALEDNTALIVQQNCFVMKLQKDRSVYHFDAKKNYQMISLYEED